MSRVRCKKLAPMQPQPALCFEQWHLSGEPVVSHVNGIGAVPLAARSSSTLVAGHVFMAAAFISREMTARLWWPPHSWCCESSSGKTSLKTTSLPPSPSATFRSIMMASERRSLKMSKSLSASIDLLVYMYGPANCFTPKQLSSAPGSQAPQLQTISKS